MVLHALGGSKGTGCVSLGIPAWNMSEAHPVTVEAEPADDFVPLSQGNYVWRPGTVIEDAVASPSNRHVEVAHMAARALRGGAREHARTRSRSPQLHPNSDEIRRASAWRPMGAMPSASLTAVSSVAPAYPGMGYVPQHMPQWAPVPSHGGTPLAHAAPGFARHANQGSPHVSTPAIARATTSSGHTAGQAAPPVVDAAAYARETAASFLNNASGVAEAAPAPQRAVPHRVPSECGSPTSSEQDAELQRLCERLERRFPAARTWANTESQTTVALSWPACVMPAWAWQAHAARLCGRSAADRVLVELSSPALTWARKFYLHGCCAMY